jgi:hypothetical protein
MASQIILESFLESRTTPEHENCGLSFSEDNYTIILADISFSLKHRKYVR